MQSANLALITNIYWSLQMTSYRWLQNVSWWRFEHGTVGWGDSMGQWSTHYDSALQQHNSATVPFSLYADNCDCKPKYADVSYLFKSFLKYLFNIFLIFNNLNLFNIYFKGLPASGEGIPETRVNYPPKSVVEAHSLSLSPEGKCTVYLITTNM